MRRLLLLIVFAASCSLLACGSSRPADSPDPGPAPVAADDAVDPMAGEGGEPAKRAGETKEGTLVYEQLPRTKSVRAYTGAELFLERDGERITLRPTAAVPRDQLLGLAGKRVRVQVEWTDGHPPAPGSSAPLGMDGQPMMQGAGWRVLAVAVL